MTSPLSRRFSPISTLFGILVAASACDTSGADFSFVYGDEEERFPAVGRLYTETLDGSEKKTAACLATLIDPMHIATAAHCVDDVTFGSSFRYLKDGIWKRVDVDAFITSRAYNPASVEPDDSDFALARLKAPIEDIAPIPLATDLPDQFDGLGMGRHAGYQVYGELIMLLSNGALESNPVTVQRSTGLLTGDANDGGLCKGDSGGPLLYSPSGTYGSDVVVAGTLRSVGIYKILSNAGIHCGSSDIDWMSVPDNLDREAETFRKSLDRMIGPFPDPIGAITQRIGPTGRLSQSFSIDESYSEIEVRLFGHEGQALLAVRRDSQVHAAQDPTGWSVVTADCVGNFDGTSAQTCYLENVTPGTLWIDVLSLGTQTNLNAHVRLRGEKMVPDPEVGPTPQPLPNHELTPPPRDTPDGSLATPPVGSPYEYEDEYGWHGWDPDEVADGSGGCTIGTRSGAPSLLALAMWASYRRRRRHGGANEYRR